MRHFILNMDIEGRICNDLSISGVKMNISEIFWNFNIGRHFEVPASFLKPEVVPEVQSNFKIAH